MDDLMKIIQLRDEIEEVEYTISRLILAEQMAVDEENYEKANVMLKEQIRLRSRKKYLNTKINKL